MPEDNFRAYCKLCKKIFSVAGKGEGCVKEHCESAKHKEAERAAVSSHSLNRFFFKFVLIFLVKLLLNV